MFKVKVKIPAKPAAYWYERNERDNFKTIEEMSNWLRRMHQIYSVTNSGVINVAA